MAIGSSKQKAQTLKNNASALKILGACIFVCIVFVAGFMLRGNADLMGKLGFPSVVVSDTNSTSNEAAINSESVSTRIAEVETLLDEESIVGYDLNTVTDTLVKDLVASTNDPYLVYYNAVDYQNYLSQTTQSNAGIGVLFGEYDGKVYAVDVFEGSEAEASGVLTGDYITEIDGQSKTNWTLNEVTQALSREEGSTVHVSWVHPSSTNAEGGTSYSTNLHYAAMTQENITTELSGSCGYIQIHQISSDSASLVKNAVQDLTNQGATSFVLDLRDVSGGYLTQATDIASLFVQSGNLIQIKTSDSTTARTASGNTITSAPLVALINENTAGAAEVLASALQESGRASLVGSTTLGKGTVQVMQPLSFGGAIRYTAATYLTVAGREIDGNGIRPDVSVSNVDRQKTIAIDFASTGSTSAS